MQLSHILSSLMYFCCHFLVLNLLIGTVCSHVGSKEESLQKFASKAESSSAFSMHEEQSIVRLAKDDEEELKHATICVYEESSCILRVQGEPGIFVGCNREVPGEMCLHFPTAGVIFRCETSDEAVEIYPTGSCEASEGVSHQVACLDVSANAYFLLCCSEQAQTGEMCSTSQKILWSRQAANKLRGN